MRIIINADDLGASQKINDAIFNFMSRGIVSSATILVNAPALNDALTRIPNYPDNSFGIHLNLTQYRPVSSNESLGEILDNNGNFTKKLFHITPSFALLRGILFELSCQIEKLQDGGVIPSHIDSHHHIHTIPFMFPVIKRLQQKFGIRKVRLARNLYSPSGPAYSKLLLIKKRLWNYALRNLISTTTTSTFTDFKTFVDIACNRNLTSRSIELQTHPGNEDVKEDALLQSGWMDRVPFETSIISYRDL
jgi:predicted glycoside hydrolase/deacetylase ChbG (UPF0249 family)